MQRNLQVAGSEDLVQNGAFKEKCGGNGNSCLKTTSVKAVVKQAQHYLLVLSTLIISLNEFRNTKPATITQVSRACFIHVICISGPLS